MAKLILCRHGETEENRAGLLQGRTPGTLSAEGWKQAGKLAERLAGEGVDALVCSDLQRAMDTAGVVGRALGLQPRTTPLLREMDWGEATGRRLVDIDWEHLPAGAESLKALAQRAREFLSWLKEEFGGQTVAAVGHGVINRAITGVAKGLPPQATPSLPIMGNAGFTLIEI